MARASFIQAVACLSLCLIAFTAAHPDGAPVSACESMHPVHPGIQAQPDPAPYTIKANSSTFTNGQPVAVQIVGPNYQGFLLQARANGSTMPLGSWINLPPNTRVLQCAQNPSGAVTHANTNLKTKDTTYTWMPPNSNCPSTIIFMATAAESFQKYFVGIKSDPLQRDPAATCGSIGAANTATSSDNTTSISTSSYNTTSNWTSTTKTPSNSTAAKVPSASTETVSTWMSCLLLLLAGHLFLVLQNLY